ncbi:MAG: hypothetical protein ACTSVY_15820 [Candidatus Helarchaeota archaeon]
MTYCHCQRQCQRENSLDPSYKFLNTLGFIKNSRNILARCSPLKLVNSSPSVMLPKIVTILLLKSI